MEGRHFRYPLREGRAKIHVFGDESSQTGHRYMALGALITGLSHDELEKELVSVKEAHHLFREVKWQKVPSHGKFLDGYKALVTKFVSLPVRYKVFIVDTALYPLSHVSFSSSKELGFYKYFYQLLYVGIMRQDPRHNYQVYLDPKPMVDMDSAVHLERCINKRASIDEFPDMWGASCCIVEELYPPSACIELTDLLTGMTAARWNCKVKSPSKLNFTAWAQNQLGIDLSKPSTVHGNRKFNIWAFKPTSH